MKSIITLIGLDWNPNARKIKRFAFFLFCGAVLASVILFAQGRPQWRWIASAGALCALTAYFWRGAGVWMHRLLNGLICVATFTLTAVLLAVAYYAFITPFAMILRNFRKSPLNLKPERARSYWIEIPASDGNTKKQYERLY